MDDSDKKNLTYVLVDRNQDRHSNNDSKNTETLLNNDINYSDKATDVINQNDSQIMGRRYDRNDNSNKPSNETSSIRSEPPLKASQESNLNYYISVSLLSIIAYMILAYSSNVSFVELVDLEIPLIIILSLTIVFLSSNWSRIYTYLVIIAVIVIMMALSFNYSFFVMIVLFSELVIYSLNAIINNKDDYTSV